MLRAARLIQGAEKLNLVASDTITLDRASRYRRRVVLQSDQGNTFLLDLFEAMHMAHGDLLELDTGALIRVVAAAEPLLEIHANGAAALARIAWHIGNRHIAAEITGNAIYIQPDHVLEAMVEGLGAHAHHVNRPFEPEGGAYGGKGPLHKGHSHDGHSHGGHGHASTDHHHDQHHREHPLADPKTTDRRPD